MNIPDPNFTQADPSIRPDRESVSKISNAETELTNNELAREDLTSQDSEPQSTTHSITRNIWEWAIVIGGALAVALLIKLFLFQAFYIPSASMEPTLTEGDRVVVNKLSYRLHTVNRGDVVVFQRPPNEPHSNIEDLIKRVIGLPGETIEGRDGIVYINGLPIDEPYLPPDVVTTPFAPIHIPDHHVLVMGDNRMDSRDGRTFGPINTDLIIGRAFVKVWPLSRLGGL